MSRLETTVDFYVRRDGWRWRVFWIDRTENIERPTSPPFFRKLTALRVEQELRLRYMLGWLHRENGHGRYIYSGGRSA